MRNWKRILRVVSLVIAIFLLVWLILSLQKANPFRSLKQNQEFKTLLKKAEEAEKVNNLTEAIAYLEKLTRDLAEHRKVYIAWLELARIYEKNNQLLEAQKGLSRVISESPDGQLIEVAQRRLGNLNLKILFSSLITENDFVYEVKQGDSLSKISKQFNTTIDLLVQANRLKDDNLAVGMKLKVHKAKFSLLIDKSQNTLTLKADEKVLKVYPVSTGLNNITPVGTFKIINKVINPVWYKEGRAIPSSDPENILGSRWLGISEAGYGIHGTIQPETIGKHITQGCVRMYNQDVEELSTILPLGTEVVIME